MYSHLLERNDQDVLCFGAGLISNPRGGALDE
jgi:hypothetical protein